MVILRVIGLLKRGVQRKQEAFFNRITIITAIPFLMSGGGHGHGGAHGHDAHHDEAAYDAFKVKFDKVYDEHRKSAQQIKLAHSRAHEAAEDAIGKDYQGLVAEGEAGDKLRDTYKTTLRS